MNYKSKLFRKGGKPKKYQNPSEGITTRTYGNEFDSDHFSDEGDITVRTSVKDNAARVIEYNNERNDTTYYANVNGQPIIIPPTNPLHKIIKSNFENEKGRKPGHHGSVQIQKRVSQAFPRINIENKK